MYTLNRLLMHLESAIARMLKFLAQNKRWLFNGAGALLIAGLLSFYLGSSTEEKPTRITEVAGNSNAVTAGDNSPVTITNTFRQRPIAVVDVLSGIDLHLGDNIYPGRYGLTHNPLNMDIYDQRVPGIVYYDKKRDAFYSGDDHPTVLGQVLVDYFVDIISKYDFSCYEWVRAYSPDDPYYPDIIKDNGGSDNLFMLGPTALVAEGRGAGNFYERYAAVGITRSVSLLSECKRAGVDFNDKNNIQVSVIIYCYHGGIEEGQEENFVLQFNEYAQAIPSKTKSMRDPQEIEIIIPPEHVNFKGNNFLYVYVLPWQEELPILREGAKAIRPVHFRDVGIIHLEVQVVQSVVE